MSAAPAITAARRRMPSGDRRQQLLAIAQAAFADAGYRGTTTLEIARRAGVSEKLVLKHFASKEGMFRAAILDPLIELIAEENRQARARLQAGAEDTPESAFRRVHHFLTTWARLTSERGPTLFSFMAELREFPDVAVRFEEQVDEACRILATAAAHPAFRPFSPRVAFLAALGAATTAGMSGEDPAAFLDEYLAMTLFGVLSDQGRAMAAQQPDPRLHGSTLDSGPAPRETVNRNPRNHGENA